MSETTPTLVCFLLGCVLLPTPASADTRAHPCLGRWTGHGQNGGSPPWAIDLVVASTASACGTIEYDSPNLDCGGTLRQCAFEESAGSSVEQYSHNVGCTPPGRIEFRCEGETMTWKWYDRWQTVTTRLVRVPGSAPPAQPTPPPTETTEHAQDDRVENETGDPTTPRPAETPGQPASGCGACSVSNEPVSLTTALLLVAPLLTRRRHARTRGVTMGRLQRGARDPVPGRVDTTVPVARPPVAS